MSTLIVALPVPPRLSSQGAAGAALAPADYEHVLASGPGGSLLQAGRNAPTQLPAAQELVAVVPVQGVGWHRVALPKAPAPKLRAALAGVLEDVLLEDDAELHLALAPDAKAGEQVWVAAVNKAWLKAQLQALEASGRTVDRVVPAWVPDDAPAGHFFPGQPLADGSDAGPQLAWRDAAGPLCLPAASEAARTLVAGLGPDVPVRWTAEPECAAEAQRLAGDNLAALSSSEFLANASRSAWNLRQFDLVAQRRGSRAAKELLQQLWSAPAWRPARFGVAALLLLNVVGINLWAWQQNQSVKKQKSAMVSLLQTTFPQVRAVVDAPAQMQKEVDLLRVSAGKPGEADLEPLLYAAEAAWPPSRAPADGLKFEPGQLTITSAGWSPQEVEAFRTRLQPLGYEAESVPGRLTLRRAPLRVDGAGDAPAARPGPGPAPVAAPPGMQPPPPRPVPGAAPPPQRPLPQAQPVQPMRQPAPAPQEPPAQPEQPHRMPGQSPTGVSKPDI
jgi:general secretion pathway protein L